MFVFGFTRTAALKVLPVHPSPLTGVMVNVVVAGFVDELVRVPLTGVPDPGLVIPVIVPLLLRVQLKTVPGKALDVLRSIGAIAVPLQIDWLPGVAIPPTGFGLTVRETTTDVSFPQLPFTMHWYWRPFKDRETFVRLNVEEVAPLMFAKLPLLLSCHW